MPRIKGTPKHCDTINASAAGKRFNPPVDSETSTAKKDNLIERTCTKIFKRNCSSLLKKPHPLGQNISRRKSRNRNSVSHYSDVDSFFESHIISSCDDKTVIKNAVSEQTLLHPDSFHNSPFKDPLQAVAFFTHAAAMASSSTPFMPAIPLSTNMFMKNSLPIPPLGLTQRLTGTLLADNFSKPSSTGNRRDVAKRSPSKCESKIEETPKKTKSNNSDPQKCGSLSQSVEKNNSYSNTESKCFLPEKVATSVTRDRDKELIVCSICDKIMRRGSLREHMDRHLNSGKFECHLCRKTFSRASAREKHIRTHTGERPFICALCDKAYRQKVHLNEHMRSHTGERPFVCRLCGFSLTSKSLLNRHLRTHGVLQSANEAPEFWLRTDAPTSRVLAAAAEVGRSLVEEENGHQSKSDDSVEAGEDVQGHSSSVDEVRVTALNGTATVAALCRKHLCSVCPAGFPTIQALRSHRNTTHGVVTPHRCSICETSFTSIKLLKAHSRKMHPQICPICDQHMPQRRRWILEVHLREQHPGVSAQMVLGPSPLSLSRIKPSSNPVKHGRVTRGSLRSKAAETESKVEAVEGPQQISLEISGDDAVTISADQTFENSDEELLEQLNFKPMNPHAPAEDKETMNLEGMMKSENSDIPFGNVEDMGSEPYDEIINLNTSVEDGSGTESEVVMVSINSNLPISVDEEMASASSILPTTSS